MSKFKIGDKIMGISTDMIGERIVSGTIIRIIKSEPIFYQCERLIIHNDKTGKSDTIYTPEAIEYNAWKLMQVETFYDEAKRLENKSKELREMASTIIHSKGSK